MKKYLLTHMVTNKLLVAFSGLLLLSSTVCAQISMTDIRIPGVLTIGSYSQLIESLGYPKEHFLSSINPVSSRYLNTNQEVAPENIVRCEHLIYEAFEYIRVGDSVQLVFIDLRKAKKDVYIQDLSINKRLTQKSFITEIIKRGWWSIDSIQYKVGHMEYHFYTHKKVKNILLDFCEDPYSSLVFTFYDYIFYKKIWWIEFPIMRIGGIIH